MWKMSLLLVAATLSLGALSEHSRACSALSVTDGTTRVVAKNFDWPDGNGQLLRHERDGTAKYASLTFRLNSIDNTAPGAQLPLGGLNERGLAIEVLLLSTSRFPPREENPSARPVNELEWVWVQLSNYASVAEIADHLSETKILKQREPLHYFGCDPAECFVLEFTDGKSRFVRGAELPVAALGNASYTKYVSILDQYEGFGGLLPIPEDSGALNRFIRAAYLASNYKTADNPITYARESLDKLVVPKYTKWQIIYDLKNLSIDWKKTGELKSQHRSFNE
jgi:penicillin V acylase-like amidase (Ntn superfamily)